MTEPHADSADDTSLTATEGVVRVLRGKPGPFELVALVTVLTLAGGRDPGERSCNARWSPPGWIRHQAVYRATGSWRSHWQPRPELVTTRNLGP
jgi:hypothetical protein